MTPLRRSPFRPLRALLLALPIAASADAQESRAVTKALFTVDPADPSAALLDRDGDRRPDGLRDVVIDARGIGGAIGAAAAAEIAARFGLEVCAAENPPTFLADGPAPDGAIVVPIYAALDASPQAALAFARRFAASYPEAIDDAAAASRPSAPRAGKARRFGLDALFDAGGLLTDANDDLVPDGSDATLIPSGEDGSAEAAVAVAFRLGLESAGLRFPIAQTPEEAGASEAVLGPVVLIGSSQPLVEDLKRRGRLGLDPPEGEGEVSVVVDAFGKHAAVVVRGGGAEGLRRAGRLFFEKIPHLVPERLGAPGLSELATEARRLVSGVSIEGQRARMTREIGVLSTLYDGPCDGVRATADAMPGGRTRGRIERRWALSPGALKLAEGRSDFVAEAAECGHWFYGMPERFRFEPQWEVLGALERVEAAIADVDAAATIEIEARVSEPPGERSLLASRLRDLLPEAAREKARIVVRSAWKPGFSFVVEELLPKWRTLDVVSIELGARAHEIEGPGGVPSTLEAPTRLLQELYPADDLVARELGLKVGVDVTLALLPKTAPHAYVFRATTRDGATVEDVFDVDFHVRPFDALRPEVESVAVSAGLVRVVVDGVEVVRETRRTDLEELWDSYQHVVLRRVKDLVLVGTNGRPEPRHAPWFSSLHINARLSEPDDALPHDLGRSSAVDMFHEELYFRTLGSVASLGTTYADKAFRFPGKIVPRMTSAPGAPPYLEVELVPRHAHGARVEALLKKPDGEGFDVVATRELRPIDVPDPRVVALRVDRGGVFSATVRFRCDVVEDDRAAWLSRHRPEEADERVFAVDQGVAIVEETSALRAMGGRRAAWFAYPGVGRVRFEFAAGDVVKTADLVLDPADPPYKFADKNDAPLSFLPEDRPLLPSEAGGVLAVLAERYKDLGLRVRHSGESTGGRDLWTLESGPFPPDLGAPPRHVSRKKLAAWKPTLAISAREHANEVSSTTHVLQFLRDVLEGDPALLKDVRFVINPVWNADGAALAMELAEDRAHDLLHAGYLGSFGENLTVGQDERDPFYVEAKLRLELFDAHLPDVFFNPHGYPMHEWVQPFSGYAAWVKERAPKTRDWWIPRGAFIQSFHHADDEGEPAHARIAEELRARLSKALRDEPAVRALNDDQYARYARWSAFLPDDLRLPLKDGVAIYGPIRGVDQKKDATSFTQRRPKTCLANVVLEVPDETASGEHLKTVCAAGRATARALAAFLRDRSAHPDVKTTLYKDGGVRVRARTRVQ
jgi:hypothetical protein